ncbi:trans-sulfuration enzyme family protein [Alkaliphilus crotonatoxidans]
MKFETKLIHNQYSKDAATGALGVPIYQVSTFHQEDIEHFGRFEYSRVENPTRTALEETIAQLEGGAFGFAFASGMAAISSVLSIFNQGDHLLVCQDVYGGTYRACTTFLKNHGIEVTFIDAQRLEEIEGSIQPNTRALYLETPSNPLLKITDLKAASRLAKAHGLLVIVDNTFLSPYLQQPLKLGADIVVHSATKFIGGHSDVVGGLATVKDVALAREIKRIQGGFGAILGPQDSWLLLRGIKTLKVRMDYQQQSAQKLAQWLENHPDVERVYYPGLKHHQDREIHFSQAHGPGAVLSFRLKSTKDVRKFLRSLKIAAVAVSLGGVETIVSYPVKMSHGAMPPEKRRRLGITNDLIRVSLGLEATEDIIEDIGQALTAS